MNLSERQFAENERRNREQEDIRRAGQQLQADRSAGRIRRIESFKHGWAVDLQNDVALARAAQLYQRLITQQPGDTSPRVDERTTRSGFALPQGERMSDTQMLAVVQRFADQLSPQEREFLEFGNMSWGGVNSVNNTQQPTMETQGTGAPQGARVSPVQQMAGNMGIPMDIPEFSDDTGVNSVRDLAALRELERRFGSNEQLKQRIRELEEEQRRFRDGLSSLETPRVTDIALPTSSVALPASSTGINSRNALPRQQMQGTNRTQEFNRGGRY
jgi:hypothetical protein